MARPTNKHDAGVYLVGVVSKYRGRSNTFKSWRKAMEWFTMHVKMEDTRYAVIYDQTDEDEKYWSIRHEFHSELKPGTFR